MNHGIGVGAVDVLLEYDSGVCPTLIKFKGLIEHVYKFVSYFSYLPIDFEMKPYLS